MSASESNSVPGGGFGLPCACCPPRRGFLGKLAALGASAMLPGELMAQAAAKAYRIDVHHHLLYPGYLDDVAGQRRGGGGGLKWSPSMSLEEMDKSGIAVSMLSLIQPSASVPDPEKRRGIARKSNDYAAQLVRDHPRRISGSGTEALGWMSDNIETAMPLLSISSIDMAGLHLSPPPPPRRCPATSSR